MTERATPRLRLTSLEWRLYVVAALAAIYAVGWRAVDGPRVLASPRPAAPPARSSTSDGARAVWLDELPPAARPSVAAPPGWAVIDRGRAPAASTAAVPDVARAPASRPLRVRTRSS